MESGAYGAQVRELLKVSCEDWGVSSVVNKVARVSHSGETVAWLFILAPVGEHKLSVTSHESPM